MQGAPCTAPFHSSPPVSADGSLDTPVWGTKDSGDTVSQLVGAAVAKYHKLSDLQTELYLTQIRRLEV